MNRSFLLCKPRTIVATCVFVLVSLGLMVAPNAQAGKPHKAKPVGYEQTYKEISSVDAGAHTITIATMSKEVFAGNQTGNEQPNADRQVKVETLKVTDSTTIEIGGQKSTLSALSKGMKVDVSKGMDEDTAGSVVVIQ